MASGGCDPRRERLDYSSIKEQDIEEEGDEFVGVPKNMKKIVTGRRRQVLEQIEQKSGANINSMRRDEEGYIMAGYERQRARARRLIKEKVDLANDVDDSKETEEAAREHRISLKLKSLNARLYTYVTSLLEVPEVNQDQLKTPVKLDLLTRLSETLQELYSETQAMAMEACKCSEELKREFFDFAYFGLRAQHNDLFNRVRGLKSALAELSEEEKKDLERLQGYQVNRRKQVDMLEKVYRGLFPLAEHLPRTQLVAPRASKKPSNIKKDLAKGLVASKETEEAAGENRISLKLKSLSERLYTYVTSPLDVPEVKQDQLKTQVKLDLLKRLSEVLQELYSETQALATEACKCSDELKREFFVFAYLGLRAQHIDLFNRVRDLKSSLAEMSEEEKEDFERLQRYQVNRRKQVDMLEKKVWSGLFSLAEHLPRTQLAAPGTSKIQSNIKKAFGRLLNVQTKETRICYYIDVSNLPRECKLKVKKVKDKDGVVLPESHTQYRLIPAKEYGPQVYSLANIEIAFQAHLHFGVPGTLSLTHFSNCIKDLQ